ncbi:YugN family protein [Ectobacillus sp. sgz5001026]|uniref:YugN family protein n=1 Tax=Ectobacillus sp. sgz5001026 TaxID=3242473 RepID=UPI0036D4051F
MQFKNTNLTNHIIEFSILQDAMKELGFILAGQWDYERVTFDYKFTRDTDYYLRIQGKVVEGKIGSEGAVVKLLTPILGKHYYPHGVEYGENETFPNEIINQCHNLLLSLSETLASFPTVE